MAGKGDRYRKVNQKKYNENWEKCFGKKVKNNGKEENRVRPVNRKSGKGR